MTCTIKARGTALAVFLALAVPATAIADPSALGPETATTGGAAYGGSTGTEPAVTELGPGERLLAGGSDRVTFSQASAGDVVEAVREDDGTVVRRWTLDATEPVVSWDGTVGGQPVKTGSYAFRVAGQATAAQARSVTSFIVVEATFPIKGRYEFGRSATNSFGGGRGHQGNDIFASCGTPLVAVRPGRVQTATTQSRAGNYVVLQDAEGASYAYMHMRDAALVKKGDRVRAGQIVGYVGDTGRADGCHLHFERWTAPGWYEGGDAIDPRPELKLWEKWTADTTTPTVRSGAGRSRG